MLRILSLFLALSVAGAAALAQTAAAGSIQATGTASLNVQPDQVQLSVSVVTQADYRGPGRTAERRPNQRHDHSPEPGSR